MTDTLEPVHSSNQTSAASRSYWSDVWRQFRTHKGAMAGAFVLTFITLGVLIGPWIWTLDPQLIDIRARDMRPIYVSLWDDWAKTSWDHPLGTDNLGRDLLAQIIAGGRASMAVGWAAMILSLVIAVSLIGNQRTSTCCYHGHGVTGYGTDVCAVTSDCDS